MKIPQVGFICSLALVLFIITGWITFGCIPSKNTFKVSSEAIGAANFVWKIPFDDGYPSFDDVLDDDNWTGISGLSHSLNVSENETPATSDTRSKEINKTRTANEPQQTSRFVPNTSPKIVPNDGVSEELFDDSDYDLEFFQKLGFTNEYNNALCKRALDEEITKCNAISNCSSDFALFWERNIYDGCTTDFMRQYEEKIDIGSICHAQVHTLLQVMYQVPLAISPINQTNFFTYLAKTYPLSVLIANKVDKNVVLRLLSSTDMSNDEKIARICHTVLDGAITLRKDSQTVLKMNYKSSTSISWDVVKFLRPILDKREHLIEASSPPHMATQLLIITKSENRHTVAMWANSHFDWKGGDSPKRTFYKVNSGDEIIRILKEYITQEKMPKTMYIIETLDKVDTVRKVMNEYLYAGDLDTDHWFYFFPTQSSAADIETKKYLDANAWADVHWIDDLTPANKTSPNMRVYGLKRKNPKKSSWIVHVRKGSMRQEDIPESFDWRDQLKSKCLYPVYSQGSCGSCWAISSAEMVSAAKCIKCDAEFASPVSVQDILSCVNPESYGCRGAYMTDALLTARELGFANQSCQPYFNGDCNELSDHGFVCSQEASRGLKVLPTSQCNQKCEDGSPKKRRKVVSDIYWLNVNHNGRTSPALTASLAQEYIMKYGPVITGLAIYTDFEGDWADEGKVYVHKHDSSQRLLGGHAVVLIGWGVEKTPDGKTTNYWIAKNSWSDAWGDKGFFRVIRGQGGG